MAQHPETVQSLGQKIRELRNGAGLSQRDLASKVGVSFPHISKIENGFETASAELLQRIATALDASVDELMSLAQRVPDDLADFIVSDELARTFLRKLKSGDISHERARAVIAESEHE